MVFKGRLDCDCESCLDFEHGNHLKRMREACHDRESELCLNLERETVLGRDRDLLFVGEREGAVLSRRFSRRHRGIIFTSSFTPRVIFSSSEELMYC